jgi:hypothetical protein
VYIACRSPLSNLPLSNFRCRKFPAVEIVPGCRNFQEQSVRLERGDVMTGVHRKPLTHIKTISENKRIGLREPRHDARCFAPQ